MAVNLTPEGQLGFHRPFTQLVKRTLTVANPNDRPIMFKVKTTAPKQYCVRPNSGRIEPNERLEVQVLLQPMKEEPPLNVKCRDKFLVQSAVIPKERDVMLMSELWAIVEKEDKSTIQEQKIRCVYLPPNEGDSHHAGLAGINGAAASPTRSEQDARQFTPDESAYGSVRSGSAHLTNGDASFQAAASTLGHSDASPNPDDSTDAPSSVSAAATSAARAVGLNSDLTTTSKAPAAVDSPTLSSITPSRGAGPSSSSSLEAELAAAQSKIQRLETQLKEVQSGSQLRQRNVGTGTKPVIGHDTQMAPVEGVPVHVVFGIAFAVFFVTWLFF